MAGLSHRELLQPSLLDRLTVDRSEIAEKTPVRKFTASDLHKCVLRDLEWLFNTGSLESGIDLSAFPQVRSSVLNFGLRDLAGTPLSQLDIPAVEYRVKQAILNFESRIDAKTLRVTAQSAPEHMNKNALSFLIEGDLWAHPLPLRLRIRSDFDLETGRAAVFEGGG